MMFDLSEDTEQLLLDSHYVGIFKCFKCYNIVRVRIIMRILLFSL